MPSVRIINADCREALRALPDESAHCVVTSPPYWRLRDYGVDGQIGLEETPQAFVEGLVDVFREVRRVLRSDGTLWLNLGDSYAGAAGGRQGRHGQRASRAFTARVADTCAGGLKPKDIAGIPWRVALALQDDGWWLRSDIVWAKANPMPESVRDRPTKAHEYVFLLAKSRSYFFDQEAVREAFADRRMGNPGGGGHYVRQAYGRADAQSRNLRTVWPIATQPYQGAHFATFPRKLVEPCIKAGTSEGGCCSTCGAPRRRIIERIGGPPTGTHIKNFAVRDNPQGRPGGDARPYGADLSEIYRKHGYPERKTIGWRAPCDCDAAVSPCVVLDPFGGAGTTGLVAQRLGRSAVLIEINPDYCEMARRRIVADAPLFADVRVEQLAEVA